MKAGLTIYQQKYDLLHTIRYLRGKRDVKWISHQLDGLIDTLMQYPNCRATLYLVEEYNKLMKEKMEEYEVKLVSFSLKKYNIIKV
jgi:hypothetical protein